jgi:AcrR family transcriptional regulator
VGRSTLHATDALLDAAVELFAAGGARAVTMTAVARRTGAPSGSVYHRFPGRGALLAALWRRTASEFEGAFRDVLGPAPTPQDAVRAARWMVDWCRAHPGRAAVLNGGPQSFEPETWPSDALRAHRAGQKARDRAIASAVTSVADIARIETDEAAFALFGLPMAVVGEHLRRAEPVPAGASALVGRLAARLLRLDEDPE